MKFEAHYLPAVYDERVSVIDDAKRDAMKFLELLVKMERHDPALLAVVTELLGLFAIEDFRVRLADRLVLLSGAVLWNPALWAGVLSGHLDAARADARQCAVDDAQRNIKQSDDAVAAARTLAELQNVLTAIDDACEFIGLDRPEYDVSALPNYGGEPVDALSWDVNSVLVRNDDDVWCIRSREPKEH